MSIVQQVSEDRPIATEKREKPIKLYDPWSEKLAFDKPQRLPEVLERSDKSRPL
jgi:hypothetical protein